MEKDQPKTITTTSEDEDWIKSIDGGKWQKQDESASELANTKSKQRIQPTQTGAPVATGDNGGANG